MQRNSSSNQRARRRRWRRSAPTASARRWRPTRCFRWTSPHARCKSERVVLHALTQKQASGTARRTWVEEQRGTAARALPPPDRLRYSPSLETEEGIRNDLGKKAVGDEKKRVYGSRMSNLQTRHQLQAR
jgi:hypothetical protein